MVAIVFVLLTACTAPAGSGLGQPSDQSSTLASPGSSTALPSSMPTPLASVPELVFVTFRLMLTGTVPADAAFAIQSGEVGKEGGAVYLCSYYGGWPVCESGTIYDEMLSFAPGARVTYRFWRELDINGAVEEIKTDEFTVGTADQVVLVSYDVQP